MRYHVFQGSCGCQKALEKHLAGLKHRDKANAEKVQIELNIEAKAEINGLVDVPINKDLKDNFIVKSIIDEVIQNLIEVTDRLDHENVQHLESGKRPKFKIDKENEKMSYYCALCEVSCGCQNDFEKHLAWVKHIEKINEEKEKHTYKSWGNLDNTEMEKVIYHCALCQVSCNSQKDIEKHLAGMKHADKANREKYTWKASNMKK